MSQLKIAIYSKKLTKEYHSIKENPYQGPGKSKWMTKKKAMHNGRIVVLISYSPVQAELKLTLATFLGMQARVG